MAAQKHMATEEAHEGFIRKLEHSLKTGQGISLPVRKPGPFSLESVIKDRHPESSKKRTGKSRR
jgi:hypothetical protein